MRKIALILMLTILALSALPSAAQDDPPPSPGLPDDRPPIHSDNIDQLEVLLNAPSPISTHRELIWSRDGNVLLAVGFFSTVAYETDDFRFFYVLEEEHTFGGAAVSFDSQTIAVSSPAGIKLFDVANLPQASAVIESPVPLGQLKFSPDNSRVAAMANGSRDIPFLGENAIYLFDVNSGQAVGTAGYPFSTAALTTEDLRFWFTPDGGSIITTNVGSDAHTWPYGREVTYRDPYLPSKEELIAQLEMQTTVLEDAPRFGWKPYGDGAGNFAVWLSGEDGAAYFSVAGGDWEAVTPNASGEGPYDEAGRPQRIDGFAQLSNPEWAQAAGTLQELMFPFPDGMVGLITTRTAAPVAQRYVYDAEADVLMDRQSGVAAPAQESGGVGRFRWPEESDYLLRYYHTGEQPLPPTLAGVTSAVRKVVGYAPNGYLLIYEREREAGRLVLVNPETNEEVVEFENLPEGDFETEPGRVAFSVFGGLVAGVTGTAGSPVYVWDATTGERLGTITPPGGRGQSVSFSADGAFLAVGLRDAVVILGVTE